VESLRSVIANLRALEADPSRRDIAWLLGIDKQVLDPNRRAAELGNWLRARVLPRRAQRAAAAWASARGATQRGQSKALLLGTAHIRDRRPRLLLERAASAPGMGAERPLPIGQADACRVVATRAPRPAIRAVGAQPRPTSGAGATSCCDPRAPGPMFGPV